jgi:hypothetical protein
LKSSDFEICRLWNKSRKLGVFITCVSVHDYLQNMNEFSS